ncbi:hypothetical protein [Streptomyces auratus]|uniref:Uncharacterized protein n=1 Tax=Streptomyces auratus AGR0001 TaxID=1160718 RepID=A0A8B1NSK6_9ACTN|nr:hypothetical protein [Streptomyces auratus]QTZ96548.1 hypothetical protein SU9_016900 [Streptomyces auratus AGR0001]
MSPSQTAADRAVHEETVGGATSSNRAAGPADSRSFACGRTGHRVLDYTDPQAATLQLTDRVITIRQAVPSD